MKEIMQTIAQCSCNSVPAEALSRTGTWSNNGNFSPIDYSRDPFRKGVTQMSQLLGLCRLVNRPWCMKVLTFAFTFVSWATVFAPASDAQTESLVDTIRALPVVGVRANDTFNLDFYLKNVDTVGAFNFRITYNNSLIEPLTDTTISGVDTTINVEMSFLRTHSFESFGFGLPAPGVATFIAIDFTLFPISSLYMPQAGALVRSRWRVKSGAAPGTTPIAFVEDPSFPSSFNTLTDYRASIFKRPTKVNGSVTIVSGGGGGGDPLPNAPVVQQPPSPVSISQGDLITFNVTATDPDGDSLSLLAFNLPPGAQFTPANPVRGLALTTGTFRWTPSFSQSGSFVVSFQATDAGGLTSTIRNVTIDVIVVPRDLLFTTSTPELEPQGGVPGAVGVVIPINFVQVQNSYGVQFDFVYDPASFTPTSIAPSNRLDGFSIYDNLGEEPGRIRVVAFSLNGDPIGAGTTSVLFVVVGNIPPGAAPGVYDISFENAFESINPDPNVASVELATENGNVFVDFRGDVNLDGRIDVADLVNIVGYILGDFTLSFRQFVAADVVTDNMVDVFDLVEIINIIFGEPTTNSVPSGAPAVLQLTYDPHDGPYGSYRLSADLPDDVAGAQFEIKYNKALMSLGSPERTGSAAAVNLYSRSNGNGRVSAILLRNPFESGSKIPAGYGTLLRIPVLAIADGATPSARIEAAKISDPDANKIEVSGISPVPRSFALEQNYPNPFNGATVISFSIDEAGAATVDARLDVFNVLGQKVKTLHQGELATMGSYSFTWDGTDSEGHGVASGVYFYRLSFGDKNESRKMVLLK